jgi:hypothetical protein
VLTSNRVNIGLHLVRMCSLVLIAATAAGCAGSMGTIRPKPAGPPPVTAFDGSYSNTIIVIATARNATDAPACQTPGQPIIKVTDGRFSYAVPHPAIRGNPTPIFQATVAPDGSFSGKVNDGSLHGRIDGNHLEGGIDGVLCRYGITGNRM